MPNDWGALTVYTAFSTLILNLIVAAVLTPVCNAIGARGLDETRAEQYL